MLTVPVMFGFPDHVHVCTINHGTYMHNVQMGKLLCAIMFEHSGRHLSQAQVRVRPEASV